MGKALVHVGTFCTRFRWPVVAVWLILAFGFTFFTNALGPTTNNAVSLPGTDSQAAFDLLAAEFPPQQNGSSPAVYHVTSGRVDDNGPNQEAITKAYNELKADNEVSSVTDPFANPAAGLISADGTYAFIPILLKINSYELTEERAEKLFEKAMDPVSGLPDMQSAVGGPIGSALSTPDTAESEKLGMLAAAVILALTFGSLIAMGMPLISAIVGLLLGLAGIWLLGVYADIPSIGITLARMIGLGVGIDYALFIVSKHRSFMQEHGLDARTAATRAVATSGGAIIFAGGTVIIALMSLQVAGIPFITSLGWACAVAVATAALAAITLLPALLAIIGNGVVRFRIPLVGRRIDHPIARRWAGAITAHPIISAAVAVALLIPLAIPTLTLTLGQEDIGVTPLDTTQRQAFDLMSDGFGPGYNGPLLVSVSMEPPAEPSEEYDEQYAEATSLQSQLEVLQVTLPEQQAELEQQEADLLQQQAELEQQQADLEAEAAKLKKRERSLREDERTLSRAASALRAEARVLRGRASAELARVSRLIAREKKLGRDLVANKAERERLTVLLSIATRPVVISELEKRLAAAERRGTAIRERLATNTERLRVARVEAERLRAQASSIEARAAQLERERASLERRADRLAREARALKVEQAELVEQADELKQQADALQQEADALQAQADEAAQMQAQAEALQQELVAEVTKAGGDPRGTDPRIVELQDALATPADVDVVVPPQINGDGTAVILSVIADTRPADPLTADLVTQLRTETIPPALSPGMDAYVGGSTASNVDLAALITAKLLTVILTVIALSSLLLLIAFRSLLVPVQAAVANMLAAGAAFGVLTAIFQWGWGLEEIGLNSPYGTVPVVSYVPLMMFAALFGLSMDYQVFVLSTIQNEYASGLSAREAVKEGLMRSAKIIVSAALIMMSVFGSFILNGDPVVKQFGVGLTTAVALASFLAILFTPATLVLFNTATWRLPRFLDRLLPDLDIEGRAFEQSLEAAEKEAAPQPG